MTTAGGEALERRYQHAVEIAREAGDITLKYFQRDGIAVERKADNSPVTVADQEVFATFFQ